MSNYRSGKPSLGSATFSLLPCPFCGRSEARVCPPTCYPETPYNPADRLYPVARCTCGAEMTGANEDYSGRTAEAAWNRRSPPPQATAEQERSS